MVVSVSENEDVEYRTYLVSLDVCLGDRLKLCSWYGGDEAGSSMISRAKHPWSFFSPFKDREIKFGLSVSNELFEVGLANSTDWVHVSCGRSQSQEEINRSIRPHLKSSRTLSDSREDCKGC